MGELLSFIAPILAIVFWLVGMSKSENEEKQQQKRPQQRRPQQPATRSTTNSRQTNSQSGKASQTSIPTASRNRAPVSESIQETFEQQKEKQLEAIQQQLQRSEEVSKQPKQQPLGEHDAIKDQPIQEVHQEESDKNISISISKNLTKKGIAQGIIMAEVLGPPRAYQKRIHHQKKYRS